MTVFNQSRDVNSESDEEFSIPKPTSKRLRGRKKKRSQSKTSSCNLVHKNITTRSRLDSSDHSELDVTLSQELEVSGHELSHSDDNKLLEPQGKSKLVNSDHGELDVTLSQELEVSGHELSHSVDSTLLEPQGKSKLVNIFI